MMLKFIRQLFLWLSFILVFISCNTLTIPFSETTIPSNEALELNEKAKENKCDIYLKDGRILKDIVTRIRSKEIVYLENSDYKSLGYEYIKEIHIKPQINSSFYIGLGLVGLSSYLITDELTSSDRTSGGILIPIALAAGSGYFFYRGIETQTTIISFDTIAN